jgi:hypothetical protein
MIDPYRGRTDAGPVHTELQWRRHRSALAGKQLLRLVEASEDFLQAETALLEIPKRHHDLAFGFGTIRRARLRNPVDGRD